MHVLPCFIIVINSINSNEDSNKLFQVLRLIFLHKSTTHSFISWKLQLHYSVISKQRHCWCLTFNGRLLIFYNQKKVKPMEKKEDKLELQINSSTYIKLLSQKTLNEKEKSLFVSNNWFRKVMALNSCKEKLDPLNGKNLLILNN